MYRPMHPTGTTFRRFVVLVVCLVKPVNEIQTTEAVTLKVAQSYLSVCWLRFWIAIIEQESIITEFNLRFLVS